MTVSPTSFVAHSHGARLSCVRRGRGAPLVLIMGEAGHQRMWGEPFLARLAEEFEVLTFDHRGIGGSSRVDEQFSLEDLVADALAVMDWAGVADAHVVGLSMGGAIAQLLALEHSDRVRSLTLAGTWPDADDVWGEGVLKLAGACKATDPETAAWMMFEANVSRGFAEDPDRLKVFNQAVLSAKLPGPVVMMQMTAAATHDASDGLHRLAVPTFVVHGTQDAVIKAAAGERLAGLIPGARLELWPGIGHLLSWEVPDRTAEVIIRHAKAHA